MFGFDLKNVVPLQEGIHEVQSCLRLVSRDDKSQPKALKFWIGRTVNVNRGLVY